MSHLTTKQIDRIKTDITTCLTLAHAEPALIDRAMRMVMSACEGVGDIFDSWCVDGPPDGSLSVGLSARVWPDGHAVLHGGGVIEVREPDPDNDDEGAYEWDSCDIVLGVSPYVAA